MKWSEEADRAIKKVPFFVRKKVKRKVEAHAQQKSKTSVEFSDVNELKKKFLSKGGMKKEIKGYEVTTCFGSSGCPNTANSGTGLAKDIEKIIEKEDILGFLKETVEGDLKFHHEFRAAISDCPNACSRPQIVDIGIIGSVLPGISDEECILCNACVEACKEKAITLDYENELPLIDYDQCLMCAKCISACPTGIIVQKEKGFRVMLGGRLGRHPRLAMEVPGLHTHGEVLQIVKKCLEFYKENSKKGERFSHILSSLDQIVDKKYNN
ncbi:MAG: 4Fe-4S binding protein [Desulfobacula sp.]|jgi:dissimilatory sulfite reductase (desulfoviridin) alpha/beta subunit|uniref:4Fe-4S dicluster domain-containing protein n=1 Tax=Desulfobacula sp. TaxID=2593537 RepID=UPI001E1923DD|nr:4Fe-4S binding protein [Desulfobacula sp.]MBT3483943.1 4Fe-4S binding protein [Desulfobacula sp.]MBT3803870.1 4Fe-4S binding protein [Desulfobacula sp.]MBT4023815.1 4Fe-4S binding protein [Desulfobacula sp.]MBT4197625.1 4Fe-4S binding protein [Desulfobacula sp.]